MPPIAWKNQLVEIPEQSIVNWPSLLFALVVDTLLVWAPTVALFFFAPEYQIELALGMLLSVMAINFWLYSRGMSFGTFLAGFRLRTRKKQPPGKAYGLVLTMISFASIPAIALMVYLSFDGGGPGGPVDIPGKSDSYPVLAERIHRRRWLKGVDASLEPRSTGQN